MGFWVMVFFVCRLFNIDGWVFVKEDVQFLGGV